MTYQFETYYYNDPHFPRKKAELITATILSRWAVYYEARLIAPIKGVGKETRKGELSLKDPEESRKIIADVVKWIHANSVVDDLFYLVLYEAYPPTDLRQQPALFDHHDTAAASWGLELNDDQFATLQKELVANDLPKDLFYPADKMVAVPIRLFGIPFGSRYYTPKQWETRQVKQK